MGLADQRLEVPDPFAILCIHNNQPGHLAEINVLYFCVFKLGFFKIGLGEVNINQFGLIEVGFRKNRKYEISKSKDYGSLVRLNIRDIKKINFL